MLRRIFGSKRKDVTGERRKLHNEELLTQYCLGDKIGKNEMGGACSAYGGEERRIQSFGGISEGRRPLGRPRRRWEDNIKMDLRKWDVGVWTGCSWFMIRTSGGH